jgi:hypothetical protein
MGFLGESVGHLTEQRKLFAQEGSATPSDENKGILLLFEDPAPSHPEKYLRKMPSWLTHYLQTLTGVYTILKLRCKIFLNLFLAGASAEAAALPKTTLMAKLTTIPTQIAAERNKMRGTKPYCHNCVIIML